MNGGYVLLDCGGLELTSVSKVTVTGIVDRVKEAVATKKPIVACNLKYSTKACNPVSVLVCQDATTATSYDVIVSLLKVVVDKDNGCTISSLAS